MDVNPTDTFKDKLEITVGGIDLELYHAPGETNDQIIVWWPSERVLFPADNVYKAFPNLYAIRGTQAREEFSHIFSDSLDSLLQRLHCTFLSFCDF